MIAILLSSSDGAWFRILEAGGVLIGDSLPFLRLTREGVSRYGGQEILLLVVEIQPLPLPPETIVIKPFHPKEGA